VACDEDAVALRLDAGPDLLGDYLVQRPHHKVQPVENARHCHYRRYAPTAMVNRTADLAYFNTEPGEVLCQPSFGQHEQRCDVVLSGKRNGAQVEAHSEIGKTRSLSRTETG